ncbi:MAG: hypothetical protein ACRETC_02685 [Gammaproteobacteria bacterium]
MYCFTLFGPFRAKRTGQGKAQCAVKGRSLGKRCNAAMARAPGSRRASRWALSAALHPLEKEPPFLRECALQPNAQRLAEWVKQGEAVH